MTLPKLHVAVLMGGWSSERPVSLMSGNGVADALEARGHRVTRIDMGRDVALKLAEAAPDVVFNALHGCPGEDKNTKHIPSRGRNSTLSCVNRTSRKNHSTRSSIHRNSQ